MQISVKRMLRTRGALVAGVTAASVGLTLAVGQALTALVSMIPISETSGLYDLQPVFPWAALAWSLLSSVLPFTVGYFFGLWVVAPITEGLRIGHVITRAILATGIGASVWFVTLGVMGVLGALSTPLMIGAQLGYYLQISLTGLVTLVPLGVLGGVLQWVWRLANPAPHHIEGLIDV